MVFQNGQNLVYLIKLQMVNNLVEHWKCLKVNYLQLKWIVKSVLNLLKIQSIFKTFKKNYILSKKRCTLINAFDELFSTDLDEFINNFLGFEQKAVNKMTNIYKALDNDRYWAQCLLNDRFTKSAQVKKFFEYYCS
jgi:hypothetical protein